MLFSAPKRKSWTCIDIWSNGRFDLGAGQGYAANEFHSLNIPRKERSARLAEGLELVRRLWTEENVSFDGRFTQVKDMTLSPKPVQQPHIPTWIGARTEKANELTGSFIPFGKHIQNFPDEARRLVILPQSAGVESLRIIIPRALVFLYTLRGKRGIGHVGGDVEANEIDITTIVRLSDWIICELIRIFHGLSLEEAQGLVDALSSRNLPDIWEVGNKKRILREGLDYKEQVLLFAYTDIQGGVFVEDLFEWTEYSSLHVFKKSVLKSLHTKRLIEYDQELECAFLSPSGVQEVEEKLLERPFRTQTANEEKKQRTRKK